VTGLTIKTNVPLMEKAKTKISKLIAKPSSLFSKSSTANPDPAADVEEEAFWIELWVEKQMGTFDLASKSMATRMAILIYPLGGIQHGIIRAQRPASTEPGSHT